MKGCIIINESLQHETNFQKTLHHHRGLRNKTPTFGNLKWRKINRRLGNKAAQRLKYFSGYYFLKKTQGGI